jgi:hypothetical protein
MKDRFDKRKIVHVALAALASLCVIAVAYYVSLPPLNPYSKDFWTFIGFSVFILSVPITMILASEVFWIPGYNEKKRGGNVKVNLKFGKATKIAIIASVGIPIAVLIVGSIFSSVFFNATAYAEIVTVENGVFEEDMPETDSITNIALMDTTSAMVLGDRTLGNLSEMVSQYELSSKYTQINYQKRPQKVSNLEYADFFRWVNNRSRGIPGFVMVDPVNNTAEYKPLETPIKYVDSAYFGEDLMRRLRFDYPTKIFNTIYFEIDEEGDPYFIVSCIKPKVGLFGAYDVSEVIIFNPCDGSSEIYPVSETPSWIDVVYTGDLASQKYNWYGTYSGGFWNSVISKVDCKQTTDDYGYIVIGDDVWYFTGVTSLGSDESNIGFIISNARTGEYKFYSVVGAEEHSAMSAAQGEVQEKGYVASFPSLVNISGEATYIMVLKDAYGLVKLYALVNVEQYNIVATGETQKAAMEAYMKQLRENGIISGIPTVPDDKAETHELTVENVRIIEIGGEPTVYITADNGNVYKALFESDESLILIRIGDKLVIKCTATETEGLYTLITWTKP